MGERMIVQVHVYDKHWKLFRTYTMNYACDEERHVLAEQITNAIVARQIVNLKQIVR